MEIEDTELYRLVCAVEEVFAALVVLRSELSVITVDGYDAGAPSIYAAALRSVDLARCHLIEATGALSIATPWKPGGP